MILCIQLWILRMRIGVLHPRFPPNRPPPPPALLTTASRHLSFYPRLWFPTTIPLPVYFTPRSPPFNHQFLLLNPVSPNPVLICMTLYRSAQEDIISFHNLHFLRTTQALNYFVLTWPQRLRYIDLEIIGPFRITVINNQVIIKNHITRYGIWSR